MNKRIKCGILCTVFCLFSITAFGQKTEFRLNKELREHVEESLLEGMDTVSNQIELLYGHLDSSGTKIVTSRFGGGNYFYPASSVKLPVLLLALEWINTLNDSLITEETPIVFNSSFSCVPAPRKKTYPVDTASIINCIKQILLVSDNTSYNTLFHLLGRSHIKNELRKKGFPQTQILKSFVGCSSEKHNNLPGISFVTRGNDTLHYRNDTTITYQYDSMEVEPMTVYKFFRRGKLVVDTIDYSKSNYLPLTEGLEMLLRLIKPELYPLSKQWNITQEQREVILKYMSIYPRESKLEKYSNYEDYPDSFKKYFMYGFLKKERISDPVRIYNIVGLASGFATDIAYIENQKTKDGFFLAGSVFTNENGKYSNGYSNYRKQAFPFFTRLGWSIYNDVYEP